MARADAKEIIENEVPGAIIDTTPFGRGVDQCLWISEAGFRRVCETILSISSLGLDWLENFSIAQIQDTLLLTYFLRSTQTNQKLILRKSVNLPHDSLDPIRTDSVSDLWPMSERMEKECSEGFGVFFRLPKESAAPAIDRERGFPMRKSFEFPEDGWK